MKKLYVLFTILIIYFTGFSQAGSTSAVLSGDTTICETASANLSVEVSGGTAPYTVTVTDGTNTYSATGESPVSIPVSPTSTATYTIVSVIGGGETGIGNSGSATITVTPKLAPPTGLQCYEIATFDVDFCEWVVTGDQPAQPTLACYQTTTFNTTTCVLGCNRYTSRRTNRTGMLSNGSV